MQTLDIEFLITAYATVISMVAAIEIVFQYHRMYRMSPEQSILKGMLAATSIAHIAIFVNSGLWLVRIWDPSLTYTITRIIMTVSVLWFKVVLWRVRGQSVFMNLLNLFGRSTVIFAAYIIYVYFTVGAGVPITARLDPLDILF